jgi:hypothetical protein
MSTSEARIQQLQQIPVAALRQAMYQLLEDEKTEKVLRERFGAILNRKLQHMKQAVQRMGRDQLTSLIDACPEISDEQIRELFEEYRYGSNPSFHIYLFDKTTLGREALQGFRQRIEEQLAVSNATHEAGLPRMRSVALNDLVSLPDKPDIVEGTYRFQTRVDYIDEAQNAVSTYQTLYGFFWLSAPEGYAIIHARNMEVLKILKSALENSAGVHLAALVISKQLKNALPFLLRDSFRAGRLHDPDPGPGRFRWLTVADENPYAKGYQELEDRYPEVRSLRYREVVGDDKETILTIRCDRGALSLTGTLKASQLRAWTLDRLGQLIGVLNEFRPNAPAYVQTHSLEDAPELAQFSAAQRKYILQIISALLTVKQSPLVGYQSLGVMPMELASKMGNWLRVQIPIDFSSEEGDSGGYLACPVCDGTTFAVKPLSGSWQLECREHKRQRWAASLPLVGETAWQEYYTLDEDDLAATMELLPSDPLVQAVADVVNRYLPGYTFDARRESFIVRGPTLVYYPDKSRVRDSETDAAKTIIYVNQSIGSIQGGEVVGVRPEPVA